MSLVAGNRPKHWRLPLVEIVWRPFSEVCKRRDARRQFRALARLRDWQLRDLGIDPRDLEDVLDRRRTPHAVFDPIRRPDGEIGIVSRRLR